MDAFRSSVAKRGAANQPSCLETVGTHLVTGSECQADEFFLSSGIDQDWHGSIGSSCLSAVLERSKNGNSMPRRR